MADDTAGNIQPKRVELRLPSIIGYEKVARGAAEAIAQQLQIDEGRTEDLKTAVAEAVMNAIEHGNDQEPATSVTVIMSVMSDQLEVRVADVGRHPIPDPLPTPTSDRGWGLFFIQHLVDEVEISQLPNGGNQVKMVLRFVEEERVIKGHLVVAEARSLAIELAVERPRAILPAVEPVRAIQPAQPQLRAILPADSR